MWSASMACPGKSLCAMLLPCRPFLTWAPGHRLAGCSAFQPTICQAGIRLQQANTLATVRAKAEAAVALDLEAIRSAPAALQGPTLAAIRERKQREPRQLAAVRGSAEAASMAEIASPVSDLM